MKRAKERSTLALEMEMLHDELKRLEQFLLVSANRRNSSAVSLLLAEEFCEFGSSGRSYTRSQIVAALAAEQPVKLTLYEFSAKSLSESTALITYRVRRGKPGTETVSLHSSVWVLRENRWQMIFHQGTPVP